MRKKISLIVMILSAILLISTLTATLLKLRGISIGIPFNAMAILIVFFLSCFGMSISIFVWDEDY